MAVKQYHQVDLQTGIILDVCLFNDEITDKEGNVTKLEVPGDYKEGWGDRVFYNPVFDFELQDWVESRDVEEIIKSERAKKDAELNQACKEAILAGFYHTIDGVDYHFSYDTEAQINFGDSRELLSEGLVSEIMWTVKKDGEYTRIPVNKEIMQELTVAIIQHKQGNISKYRDVLMPQVEAAQTVEEIQAVEWK